MCTAEHAKGLTSAPGVADVTVVNEQRHVAQLLGDAVGQLERRALLGLPDGKTIVILTPAWLVPIGNIPF